MRNEVLNEIKKEVNWRERIVIYIFKKLFIKVLGIGEKRAINNILL